MWMIELATNTITADSRMGSHRDDSSVMMTSLDDRDAGSLARPSGPSRRLLAGIALVSLAVLLLQLTLTRLFSATMYYHFAFLAIALALFGSGAGGVLVYALGSRLRGVSTPRALQTAALLFAATVFLALLVILRNPFSPVDPPAVTLRRLTLVYGTTALPFLFAGTAISLAVARFARWMSRLYVFDLGGAAGGCLLVIPLLDRLGAVDTVLLSAVLAWTAALVFAGERDSSAPGGSHRRGKWALLGVVGLGAVGLLAFNRWTERLVIRQAKGLDEARHVLFEKWNSFSRVTVWGSLAESMVLIMIDADAGTLLLRDPRVFDPSAWLTGRVEALAYHLRPGGRALVIGSGGGADVVMARTLGVREVTAVEVNPIIAEEVVSREPFRSWSGAVYEQPGVRLVVDEARSFIRSSRERYDVIQATMVDTWAATAAGAFALTENNLYTVEAFSDYLDRVGPDGIVSFTRWYVEPPDQLLRLVAIARAVLGERGARDPARHLMVVRGAPEQPESLRAPATVLLKASPFSDDEVRLVEGLAARRGFSLLFTPQTRPPGELLRLIEAEDPASVWRSLGRDVSPTHDDRPFFFQTVRLSGLQGLRLDRSDEWQKTNLGVLVQKCILFLGHPVYALSVVLFSLLAWSAVGSLATGRVAEERLPVFLPRALAAVALLLIAGATFISPLFRALGGLPRPARLAVAAAVLVPLGAALGTPMPSVVRLLGRAAPRAVPWAWGVNGAASVLGSVAAVVVALEAGFDLTLLLGAASYLVALIALRSLGRSR